MSVELVCDASQVVDRLIIRLSFLFDLHTNLTWRDMYVSVF